MKKNELYLDICPYSFEISYNRDYSNCRCDSICRCSTLTNVKIESKPQIEGFKFSYYKSNTKSIHKFTEIENYCIERILSYYKYYDISMYEVNVCNSYYGEEVSSIGFNSKIQLITSVQEMLEKNSPLQQILYTLELEYSYIPDNLKNVNTFDIIDIELNKLMFSDGQLTLIKRNNDIIYDSVSQIRGIVFDGFGKYNLVDGHHRLQYDISSNKQKSKYIVIK